MKTLKLKCQKCNKTKLLRGKTIQEILTKLDKSNWVDFPENNEMVFVCPVCQKGE